MRILTSQIIKYLNKNLSTKEIEESLLSLTYETEEILNPLTAKGNLKFAYVRNCVKHSNANKLKVCEINSLDNKEKVYQVVCGASNIDSKQIVLWSPPGSIVKGVTLSKRSIREIESEGMILSFSEASDFGFKTDEYYSSDGIMVFNKNEDFKDYTKTLNLNGDLVNVSILPDRSYSQSYWMLAKEISAFRGDTFSISDFEFEADYKLNFNSSNIDFSSKATSIGISEFHYLELGWVPWKIKSLLISSKQKTNNSIFDILSFAQKITGNVFLIVEDFKKISLKNNILKLDDKEIDLLTWNNSLINFSTSKKYKLISITSNFSINPYLVKDMDPTRGDLFHRGTFNVFDKKPIEYLMFLLKEYEFASKISDVIFKTEKKEERKINLNIDYLFKFIGEKINYTKSIEKLEKLGFVFVKKKNALLITIPNYRNDINSPQDIIEEILRMIDVNQLKAQNKIPKVKSNINIQEKNLRKLKDIFIRKGAREILSYSLIENNLAKDFNIWNTKSFVEISNSKIKKNTFVNSLFVPHLETYILNYRTEDLGYMFFESKNVFRNKKQEKVISFIYDDAFFEKILVNNKDYDPLLLSREILGEIANLFQKKINMKKSVNISSVFEQERCVDIYLNNILIGKFGEINHDISRSKKLIRLDKIKRRVYFFELFLDSLIESEK